MTVGGVLIGLLAVLSVIIPWYFKHGRKAKGGGEKTGGKGRNWVLLAPAGWAFVLGVLSALATGGIMGKTAQRIEQSSNTLGSRLLSSLAGANSPGVTRAGITMLTPGGGVLLVLVLVGVLAWFVMSRRSVRLQMAAGLIAGATLGPSAGIAGLAGVVIAPIFNLFGNWLVGIL